MLLPDCLLQVGEACELQVVFRLDAHMRVAPAREDLHAQTKRWREGKEGVAVSSAAVEVEAAAAGEGRGR